MRALRVIITSALLSLSACTHTSPTSQQIPDRANVIAALEEAVPGAQWGASFYRESSITCEGVTDVAAVGMKDNKIWVGLVPGAPGRSKPITLSFPIGTGAQDSFCVPPLEMSSYPNPCEAEGQALPGCMKGCWAFSLNDHQCDAFNFYWDNDRQTLVWWRN